jgi:YHS domain-containing protein
MRINISHLLAIVVAALGIFASFGTQDAFARDRYYTGWLNKDAASGYDVVAYFTDSKPVKGSNEFTADWNGVTWKFSSAENLEKFKADPEAYAPQYGGYCAWAMARGDFASTNPEAWRIVDGKLYLNYDKSIQKKWEADIPGFIKSANGEWEKKEF